MRPRWPMLAMTRDGFLAESYAARPLPSPTPAPADYRCSILERRFRFRTNGRAGQRFWKALIFRCATPKTQEIEWLNNEMP